MTISDRASQGLREDTAGPGLARMLDASGIRIAHTEIVPDEPEQIQAALCRLADEMKLSLVVTTGGTGLSPRDNTPEATLAVITRLVPGMAEAMRAHGLTFTPRAMLSRGVCGVRGATLIVNLPGSPKASQEGLEVILSSLTHALDKLRGDPEDCGR